MDSALMAWVLVGISLARLNNAESHWYAQRSLTGQDKLYDGNEELLIGAGGDRRFLAPVWNFLQGEIELFLILKTINMTMEGGIN